jgi:prolyl 4-hydroxylase
MGSKKNGAPKGKKGSSSRSSSSSSGGSSTSPVLVGAFVAVAIGVYLSKSLDSLGGSVEPPLPGVESPLVTPDVQRKMDVVQAKEDKIISQGAQYWLSDQSSKSAAVECPAANPGFKSKPQSKQMALRVLNKQNVQFALYWIDENGVETEMAPVGDIGPAKPFELSTFVGHGWRLRDDDGAILLEVMTNANGNDPDVFVIDVKPCTPAGISEEKLFPEPTFDAATACPELSEWVSVAPSVGYHPVCIRGGAETEGRSLSLFFEVAAVVNGWQGSEIRGHEIQVAASPSLAMNYFRTELEKITAMPSKHTDKGRKPDSKGFMPQPWALYGTDGHVVKNAEDLVIGGGEGSRLLLLFVGGRFIYPGIQINYERKVLAHDKMITLKTMSLQPLVYAVDGFLGKEECRHIIQRSAPHMKGSKVSLMDKDVGKADVEFRTSTTHFLSSQGDDMLLNVDVRIANLTRVPGHYHEQVQVLRYNHGQHYGSHHDYWPMESYTQPDIVKMVEGGWKNRLATVFWYMSDVNLGGETNFPEAVGFEPIRDENVVPECRTGLRVKPQEGKVIIFYSLLPDGTGDRKSLHGACPVGHGQKWAANKWIWNKPLREDRK